MNFIDPSIAQSYPKPYEPSDQVEKYGSIIKDLMDTEELLKSMELRWLGKRMLKDGTVEPIPNRKAYMSEDAAQGLIDKVRSLVNQNTHYTKYDDRIVPNILWGANYHINRWLMRQGENVPLGYRSMISFECMALIMASLHKANNATILTFLKGSFQEGRRIEDSPQQKQGFLQSLMPWNKKR